ncbi:hypothetical protein ABIE89_000492 [Bradyrhizobium niftali]|uniref:bestrophin-like domain n=1 Tax=Bradyrhizobium niftali TaxID=2560055 RepID=UPI003834634D
MIRAWLDFPAFELFAVLIALYGTTGAVIVIASFSPATVALVRRVDGVVAPFFGTVGVLFAFLTGFLANDITDRNRQAVRAVQSEAAELRNIYAVSKASVSDMGSLRSVLAKYVAALVDDEWPAMARDQKAHSVESVYDALLREVSDPRIGQAAGAPVQTALLNAAVGAGPHDRCQMDSRPDPWRGDTDIDRIGAPEEDRSANCGAKRVLNRLCDGAGTHWSARAAFFR